MRDGESRKWHSMWRVKIVNKPWQAFLCRQLGGDFHFFFSAAFSFLKARVIF